MDDKIDFNEIADTKITNACVNIDILIKYSGVSRPIVSQIIGENDRYLTRALNGKFERELTLSAVIKIAELFQCPIDILCENSDKFQNRFQLPKSKLNEKAIATIKKRISPFLQPK